MSRSDDPFRVDDGGAATRNLGDMARGVDSRVVAPHDLSVDAVGLVGFARC